MKQKNTTEQDKETNYNNQYIVTGKQNLHRRRKRIIMDRKIKQRIKIRKRRKSKKFRHYLQLLEYHRKVNLEKGYGTADKNYKEKAYRDWETKKLNNIHKNKKNKYTMKKKQ